MLKLSILLALMCCHITLATSTPNEEKRRPNVIIMHVDNLVNEHVIHENKKKISHVVQKIVYSTGVI